MFLELIRPTLVENFPKYNGDSLVRDFRELVKRNKKESTWLLWDKQCRSGKNSQEWEQMLEPGACGGDGVSWALSPKHCESRLINDREQKTRKESQE